MQVLAETGPEGLSISEIARRIQQSGLRDLRTSKTPEVSPVFSMASQRVSVTSGLLVWQ